MFDLRKCRFGFNSTKKFFQLANPIRWFNDLDHTWIHTISGEILPTIPGLDPLIQTLRDHIIERRRKQKIIDSYFPHLHNVVCDPGYVHDQFDNFVHPGNKEAVKRITNKWFLNMPIIEDIAKATGAHRWEKVKSLDKQECEIHDEHLSKNILAIGSAKSTFTTQKALGYDKIDDKIFLNDKYKNILRWEFDIDYNKPEQVKQKIEDIGGDTVLPDPHITKFRYQFIDNNELESPKYPIIENSVFDEEYAVLTKIPNRLKYKSNKPDHDIFIFQGLHSVGTKAIGDLMWEHSERIKEEFIVQNIDSINHPYQILFWLKINRNDDKPTKPFQPIINRSQVLGVEKLSMKKIENLPDYT